MSGVGILLIWWGLLYSTIWHARMESGSPLIVACPLTWAIWNARCRLAGLAAPLALPNTFLYSADRLIGRIRRECDESTVYGKKNHLSRHLPILLSALSHPIVSVLEPWHSFLVPSAPREIIASDHLASSGVGILTSTAWRVHDSFGKLPRSRSQIPKLVSHSALEIRISLILSYLACHNSLLEKARRLSG